MDEARDADGGGAHRPTAPEPTGPESTATESTGTERTAPSRTGLPRGGAVLVGAATAVVVGAALILGGNAFLSSPEPGASALATPEPSASPAPTVASPIGLGARPAREWDAEDPLGDFPFVRGDYVSPEGRDYSWLTRPVTGETWHDPVQIPDPGNLLIPSVYWADNVRYFTVGARGDSDIVVAYAGDNYVYTFEVAANGQGSLLPCLDATADDCEAIYVGLAYPHPEVAVRTDIFYESFSFPSSYAMGATYSISLPAPGDETTFWQQGGPYTLATATYDTGDGWHSPENARMGVLADLGGLTLLEMTEDSVLPGYRSLDYLVLTRQGRLGEIASRSTSGGSPNLITWDDGFEYGWPRDPFWIQGSVSPGTTVCQFFGQFAIDPDHDDSLWYAAGSTPEGLRIYLPTEDNPLPEQVRAAQMAGGTEEAPDASPQSARVGFGRPTSIADRLRSDSADPYLYETDQAFRDARVLWSFERPDGTWLIAMDPSAQADVYECS